MLDKTKYYEVNKEELTMGFAAFHIGFTLQGQKFSPWRKSFLRLKKATQDLTKNKNEGCTGEGELL